MLMFWLFCSRVTLLVPVLILHSWLFGLSGPCSTAEGQYLSSHNRAANSPIRDERGSMRTIKGPHRWGPLLWETAVCSSTSAHSLTTHTAQIMPLTGLIIQCYGLSILTWWSKHIHQ